MKLAEETENPTEEILTGPAEIESTTPTAPTREPEICPVCKAAIIHETDGSIACVNCGIIKQP